MTVKDILFGASKASADVVGDPYWDSVSFLTDSYSQVSASLSPVRGINIYPNGMFSASNGNSLNTTITKFGCSIYDPNGTNGIALNVTSSFSTGGYPSTIEFWMNRGTHSVSNTFTPLISIDGAGSLVYYNGATGNIQGYSCNNIVNSAASIVAVSTWNHIAYVRENATTCKLYVNGVLVASRTQSQPELSGTRLVILGTSTTPKGTTGTSGDPTYIENIRITSVARYLAPFTPPTALFPMFKTGSPQYLTKPTCPVTAYNTAGTIVCTPANWEGSPTLTYQWQSTQTTTNLTWSYTDISGATASTFTGTLTANKCYRLKTTATIGSLVTVLYSNPTYVRIEPL